MLTLAQQVNKFPANCMYGTQRISSSTVFTISATKSSPHPEDLFKMHFNIILPVVLTHFICPLACYMNRPSLQRCNYRTNVS